MRDVVIVDAVRTPVGKRNGALAHVHANDLLGTVQRAVVERSGIDPGAIGQVVGGCVQQVGMQSGNVARNAWLAAGLPLEVPATTVNVQCGSSQQATTLAHALVAGGLVDVALACGVETMSAIPMGSATKDDALGLPRAGTYAERYEATTQFQGADRIANAWGISRFDTEVFGKRSQDLAAAAWAEGRFDGQIVPVAGLERDEGLRETSLDALAGLRTNLPDADAVHTAGTSSQIADGAAAVLLATAERAAALGLRPRARIVDSVLVGSDPVLMLTGPIPATAAAPGAHRAATRRHRPVRGQRGLRLRRAGVGQGDRRRPRAHQPQRRRDRPRAPARRHRLHPAHQGAPRAGANRRPLRPRDDVLRRRPRHRHDHRANGLTVSAADLQARVARIEAYQAIQQLPIRYALAVDGRDLDTWVGLFVPDVNMGRGGQGRQVLREYIEPQLRWFYRSIHQIVGHRIELIDDDTATWRRLLPRRARGR